MRRLILGLTRIFFTASILAGFCLNVASSSVELSGANFFRPAPSDSRLWPTIEFWFKALGPGVLACEIDQADVSKWHSAIAAVLDDGMVVVGMPGFEPVSLGRVEFGAWHHLCVQEDLLKGKLNAFFDGKLAATKPGARTLPSSRGRMAVYAFGRGGASNLGTAAWFTGLIDVVRIWNVAPTPVEIEQCWDRHTINAGINWNWDENGPYSYGGDPTFVPPLPVPIVSENAPILQKIAFPLNDTPPAVVMAPHMHFKLRTGFPYYDPESTTFYFQWGRTTNYESQTIPAKLPRLYPPSYTTGQVVSNVPPGFYHYRALVNYNGDEYYGEDATFEMPAWPDFSASRYNDGWAPYPKPNIFELRGSANPLGTPITVFFEWGTSTNYGQSTLPQLVTGITNILFTATITNLDEGLYHVRAGATDGVRTNYSQDWEQGAGGAGTEAMPIGWGDYNWFSISIDQLFGPEPRNYSVEFWFTVSQPGVLLQFVREPFNMPFVFVEPDGEVKATIYRGFPLVSGGKIEFGNWQSWHHVALVAEGSTFFLYRDGKYMGSSQGSPIPLGGHYGFGYPNTAFGYIDEVRFWNSARSPEAIARNFDKSLSRFGPDLVAYWEDGIFLDTSGHNNNAIQRSPIARMGHLYLTPVKYQRQTTIQWSSGIFDLQTEGISRGSYRLFESSDLQMWTPIATNSASPEGNLRFEIPAPESQTHRFYRSVLR